LDLYRFFVRRGGWAALSLPLCRRIIVMELCGDKAALQQLTFRNRRFLQAALQRPSSLVPQGR
jgi:hypothetical protein